MKPSLLSFSRRILQKEKNINHGKKSHGYCVFATGELYTCINSSEEITVAKKDIHLDKFKISVDDE